jgi:cytochrome c5
MKRFALITAVMLGLLSVAAIAACGGGSGSTPSASPTESSTPSESAAPTESATPSSTPSSAALTGQQLVAERCDKCHGGPDRIAAKHLTKAEWTQEVDDMIAEQGAQLTAQEKTIVIDYLTATYGP